MSAADPRSSTPEVAALLRRDPAGLVAAVVQQHDTGEVLMLAWMDDEALHRTLTTGRATYWSRSRGEYWVKGETSGTASGCATCALDCDGDALLVLVDQVGAGLPHRRAQLLPPAAARRSRGARAMRFGVTSPTATEFAALAGRAAGLVPVTRRLLADSETAVGVYRKLAGNRPGTVLLESAEQGKRWSRYSFVGVRSAGVLTERDGVTQWLGDAVPGLTDDLPADPLAAVRTLARRLRSPRAPGLPPLTGGLVGYLGYDVVRRLERLPRDQRRRPRHARAGDDAGDRPGGARPHRRHGAADRQRAARRRRPGYDDAVARLDAMAADLTKAVPPGVAVLEPRRARRR